MASSDLQLPRHCKPYLTVNNSLTSPTNRTFSLRNFRTATRAFIFATIEATVTMTRWHQATCKTPDVFVDGEAPRCRTCHSVPPLKELITFQANLDSLLIPQDEPQGKLGLWWPRSVPYSYRQDVKLGAVRNNNSDQANQESPPPAQTDGTNQSNRALFEVVELPIYGETLGPDEFRLLCLNAVDDGSYPIHITLETHQHYECPEYETVSYTWGGEDGDSTPCRPIFVGPYWDVLLQTKNCWAMLRYLRPRRGIRMVWVDAICINQNNPTERASQVAKMRAIYRDCMRVVIYLGDDLVSDSTQYPARHGLHELDSIIEDSTISLRTLFSRRYFSCVWVIQELLLSRNIIIPIRGIEFWAGNLTAKHLESLPNPWNWDSIEASWVQFIGGGSFGPEELYLVLRRTWQSKASDPRDRIFGILGLINMQKGLESNKIEPDYFISAQHAFIGIFAHILINGGLAATDVLLNASGLAAPLTHSSWMPDWRRLEILKEELKEAQLNKDQVLAQRKQILGSWGGNLTYLQVVLPPVSFSLGDNSPIQITNEVRYEHGAATLQWMPQLGLSRSSWAIYFNSSQVQC